MAVFLILAAALAAPAPPAAAALKTCTPATLTGRYIFAGRGYIEPAEPGVERVHYGVFAFDGRGRMTGKQSSSRGGRIGRESLEGAYTVNEDCSGTLTFRFRDQPATETHWDIYVTGDGRTGQMIRTDPGTMAVRTFQR